MKHQHIDDYLKKLETEATDEFELLDSTGPEYFSTPELLELRGRWKERWAFFSVLHRGSILLGASSPIWILLGFAFGAMGLQTPAAISLLFFPVTFLSFIAVSIALKLHFGSRGQLEYLGRIIDIELSRRQSEQRKRS
jgi:hypothetical protein